MKTRIYLILITLSISAFSACTKEEKSYTRQELQQKTDSILTLEIKELHRQAKEDLDRRLPIELKPKVDSLLKISYDVPPPPEIEAGGDMGDDTAAQTEEKGKQSAPAVKPKLNLPKPPPLR